MKKICIILYLAAALMAVSCTESDEITDDGSCNDGSEGDAGEDVDKDAGATPDPGPLPECQHLLRPKWACVPVLGCRDPADLNMNILADLLNALNLPHTRFRCPGTLPVCCIRDFSPPAADAGL